LTRPRIAILAEALFFLLARLAFGLLCLLTSIYCLLLYIPFSYYGFIHDPILWWLPGFVRLHPYFYATSLVAVGVTLVPDLRQAKTRRPAAAFLVLNAALASYFLLFSPLRRLGLDIAAYSSSIFGLFPVIWLGAIDLASAEVSAHLPERSFDAASRKRLDLGSLGFSAIIVTCALAAISLIRSIATSGRGLNFPARLVGLMVSAGAHVAIFVTVGGAFLLAERLSTRFRRSRSVDALLTRSLAWLLCSLAVWKIALPTLSFGGALAAGVSFSVGLAVVVGFEGAYSRLKGKWVELTCNAERAKRWTRAALAAGLLLLAYAVPPVLAKTDWDFVLQKFFVLLLWTTVVMFLTPSVMAVGQSRRRMASALAVAVAFATVAGFYERNSAVRGESVWGDRITAYAGAEISFKTAADILSRSLDNGSHEAFYRLLQQHTNLTAEIPARASAVQLVSNLAPVQTSKPNIFIFVIDSLRQDYVPGYAGTADFTPQIARFAGESVEFKNAFTRYAGTALSEPAIWVGALQAHKQYIQPFYPMNNLEKLLETDGYESYISMDPILSLLFAPAFQPHRLDANTRKWGELDLIPTLREIESDIDARRDRAKPMFVYTQPQNVHTVTLETTRHGSTRQEMAVYELKRVDRAFGEFIEFLKSRGLYDNSIVVLTSDHGDSYGEFGRYGHSDFLFPEVIRIPLIIHLPPAMRRKLVWDTAQVAFSLDVTPSLYYLLGHRPLLSGELLGRPLFTETAAEQEIYRRPSYLLVSSYAPVYGVLAENGRCLFMADAVNHKGYFYDLAQDPAGTRNQIDAMRWNEGQKEIERQLSLLDQAYGIRPQD
jgi:arylsulfatase A-like enzyme